jgi:uncharacterized protein (TIGR03435 family)
MIGKILAVGFVWVGMAVAQTGSAPSSSSAAATASAVTAQAATAAATSARAYAFNVISIRENKTPVGALGDTLPFGPTADGYRMTNSGLGNALLMTAYVPQVGGSAMFRLDQVKGIPDWLGNERYDIDARIADEDRAEWQKPEARKKMLQAMLQAMFVERCKLAVHRELKDADAYSLVVAKGGPKFKETDPTVDHPGGLTLPWGGVMVPSKDGMNMYGASMASFVPYIAMRMNVGRPIQDKTGLTGKYDLVMKRQDMGSAPDEQQGGVPAYDPDSAMHSVLNDLGLKLESTKGQVETLVIDHMERPSEN